MAADALNAYLTDRAAGKDALLICDTWEMADALNRRLHDTLTDRRTDSHGCARSDGRRRRHHHEPKQRHHHQRASRPRPPHRRPRRSGPQRQPMARCRDGPAHQSRCRRTAIRQRPCRVRHRLPHRARHTGLCGDSAFSPRRDRRQLLRDPRRRRVAGDAVRGDDPRTPQQRSIPLPAASPTKPTTNTPNRSPATASTSPAAATNTPPHTTSG